MRILAKVLRNEWRHDSRELRRYLSQYGLTYEPDDDDHWLVELKEGQIIPMALRESSLHLEEVEYRRRDGDFVEIQVVTDVSGELLTLYQNPFERATSEVLAWFISVLCDMVVVNYSTETKVLNISGHWISINHKGEVTIKVSSSWSGTLQELESGPKVLNGPSSEIENALEAARAAVRASDDFNFDEFEDEDLIYGTD